MSFFVPAFFDCKMLTPWWLLDLLLASINGFLEPFDASGEKAEASMRWVRMILGHFEKEFRDIQSS